MIWITWRQFRPQALAAVLLLAAAAAYFLVTGFQIRHTYTADLASCTPRNLCGEVLSLFQRRYNTAFQLAQLLVIVVPALIGIFWGAPLIGRELENGTDQIVWNQSVSRTRWLAVKLTGIGLASVVTAGLLSWLLTWWSGPLDQISGNRFTAMTFATRDIVPIGYAAFAFALGTTVGLLLRRTVSAMAVTLLVFVGFQVLVPTVVRPNLLPTRTIEVPLNQTTMALADGTHSQGADDGSAFYIDGQFGPQGAWIFSTSPVEDSSGRTVTSDQVQNCLPGNGVPKGENPFQQFGACVAGENLHEDIRYQPADYFWPLQWAETGLCLALAGTLSGFCFWWIRRRRS